MSSMIGDRSGNKGDCAATCRMKYTLCKNGEKLKYGHLLSKKDIYGLDHIEKLVEIGVDSLKIEGRGKTLEYVGLVTDKYKSRLTFGKNSLDEKELLQIFNREGKSYGYFNGVLKLESISLNTAKNTGLYLGKVLEFRNKFIKVKLEEDINLHDGIEIYDVNKTVIYTTIVTCIRDSKFNIVNNECKKGEIIYIGDINIKLNNNKLTVSKTSSKNLNTRYTKKVTQNLRKVLVPLEVSIMKDEKVKFNIMNKTIEFDYIPDIAIKKSIDYIYINEAFAKTGNTPFNFEITDFTIDKNLFIPASKLNEFRRYITQYLINENKININVEKNYKLLEEYIKEHNIYLAKNKVTSIIKTNSIYIYKYNSNIDYKKYNEKEIYIEISDILKNENILSNLDINITVCIPNIVNINLDKYINNNLERIVNEYNINKIVIGNFGYLDICKRIKQNKNGLLLIADYGLNIANTYSSKFYKDNLVDIICLSNEVEEYMIKEIIKISNVELIQNYITVMTTRFCPISAYTNNCSCSDNNIYSLKDDFGAIYYIVSDNTDCITKIVKQYNNENKILKYKDKVSIRRNSLFG